MKYRSLITTTCVVLFGNAQSESLPTPAISTSPGYVATSHPYTESKRVDAVDPPIYPDPVGNALIGGLVTSSMKGAIAGFLSTLRGAVVGTIVQQAKKAVEGSGTDDAEGQGEQDKQRGNSQPGPIVPPQAPQDLRAE